MTKKAKKTNSKNSQISTGVLVLENKKVFKGMGIGYQGEATGEVCFNTSLTGYQEIISDPSYAGQIINFTFPHIGNVGTNKEDYESDKIWTKGVVFNSEITSPSNYRSFLHLDAWLKKNKIVGITGLDTRSLTNFIRDNGAYSAPLFYRGFKKSLCTSLNHVVCHGIPSDRVLVEGDALNVDVTAIVDEHYGDTSRMFCVGKTPVKVNNLIDATYESMMRAINLLKPGLKLGDIGYEIQSFVEKKGYSVVRDFCGHGISTTFHEPPNILHYGRRNTGMELRPGMTFTIEPMINIGEWDVKMLKDGWTAVTKDKSLSAQFEHTLGITENGYEIFTESVKGYSKPPYL